MKKTIVIATLIGFCYLQLNAQTNITSSNIIKLTGTSDTLYITGNFTNNSSATLTNTGNLFITGNVTNNQSTSLSGTGVFCLTGTSNQTITATSAFNNFKISKASGTASLASDITINGELNLTATTSKLSIASNTLTLNANINTNSIGFITGSTSSNLTVTGSGTFGTILMDQASNGSSNAIQNLIINRASQTINLGNACRLTGVLTPTAGVLASAGNLNIVSTSSNTARIAPGSTSGGYITGDVTVERYISASTNRAYRLLAPTVTTTTTIKDNWQEGVNNTSLTVNVNSPLAGYGTHITGTGSSSNGFDITQSNSNSLFNYSYGVTDATDAWAALSNTNVNTLQATTGYLIFLRGNRDNINTINTNTGNSNTTLRAKGSLILGNYTFTGLQNNGRASLVTNPYASPLLWDNTTNGLYTGTNATNFENYITIFDPNVGSRGGYITINTNNVTGGGSTNLTKEIQSGQAFFVITKAGITNPSFTVLESNKSTTSNLDVYRAGTQTEILKTMLFYTDNTGIQRCADGVTSVFNNNYSNTVNGDDALQIDNWDEDVAIKREAKLLSIESRNLADANDTIPLAIARLKTQTYKWKFIPQNFNAPNLQAFLRDNFTNSNTLISLADTTTISFTATSDIASKASNRFSIFFKSNNALPVTISSINGVLKNNTVQVTWHVTNEINVENYEVEKSSNAINFTQINTQIATGSTSYTTLDANPNSVNFYRVKAIDKSGLINYSSIVKITKLQMQTSVSIYPNPVVNNMVGLQFNNFVKGNYRIKIINKSGQTVFAKSIELTNGTSNYPLQLNNATLSSGIYQLLIEGENAKYSEQLLKL